MPQVSREDIRRTVAEELALRDKHNELLQHAINAARSVAWRGLEDDLRAEREAFRAYQAFCVEQRLEPYAIRVTS